MKVTTQAPGQVALSQLEGTPPIAPRLASYGLWQFADYAKGVGSATLVTTAAIIAIIARSFATRHGLNEFPRAEGVAQLLRMLGFFGSVFSIHGLISNDRTRGWYRFMFAKPVSPLRYYAQAFAVRGLGLLGVVTVAWALSALLIAPVSLGATLAATSVQFALVGSVTLLLATFIRFEWLAMLVLSAASAITASMVWEFGTRLDAPLWLRLLHWVLPPVAQASRFGGYLHNRLTWPFVPASSIVGYAIWVLAYAAGAFGAAMAVLKRREWAR